MTAADNSIDNDDHLELQALAGLAPQLARTLVSVAADIALVIDAEGVIQHVATGKEPIVARSSQWLGRPWVDTVTGSTRRKIEMLLSEVQANGVTRRREVNHTSLEADEVPVAYSAIRLGPGGPVVAVGRDLRAVAAIQQRFVEATQAMERDYWSQRQAESQSRTLHQVATDAVLVVDAFTGKVQEANEAAHALLSPRMGSSLVGTEITANVPVHERPGLMELLAAARTSGRPGVMRVHIGAGTPGLHGATPTAAVEVSATPLGAAHGKGLLVQMRAADALADEGESARLRSIWVDGLADALVVTDTAGRVLMCNPALMQWCQAAAGGAAIRNRPLTELLGDPAHSLATALQTARHRGLAHMDTVFIGHRDGAAPTGQLAPGGPDTAGLQPSTLVAVSAMRLVVGDQECIGLRLRALAPAPAATAVTGPVDRLATALGHLADEMGLLPLHDLLQQASALAEKHLIGQALQRCQGRLPEAGQLLGIPVATLQERMQHLGLTGPAADPTTRPPGEDPQQPWKA